VDPLAEARDDALAQVAALRAAHAEVVAAAEGANLDDEHDPEGATIAFERQQLAALLLQAEARYAEAEAALVRRRDGDYGRCAVCGHAIGAERLAARPSATLCIGCARAAETRPR